MVPMRPIDPYFILPVLAAVTTFITTWLSMKMQDTGGAGKINDVFHASNDPIYVSWVIKCVITILGSRKLLMVGQTYY